MTALEMHPDEVPHEYVMATMKAAGLLHHDTARPALAAVLPLYRAEVAEEFAAALLAVDPVEWALAGQHAGADAAKLIRRLVAAPASTGGHSCGNCEGIDPESCLANPDRATTPTSKEPRDGA